MTTCWVSHGYVFLFSSELSQTAKHFFCFFSSQTTDNFVFNVHKHIIYLWSKSWYWPSMGMKLCTCCSSCRFVFDHQKVLPPAGTLLATMTEAANVDTDCAGWSSWVPKWFPGPWKGSCCGNRKLLNGDVPPNLRLRLRFRDPGSSHALCLLGTAINSFLLCKVWANCSLILMFTKVQTMVSVTCIKPVTLRCLGYGVIAWNSRQRGNSTSLKVCWSFRAWQSMFCLGHHSGPVRFVQEAVCSCSQQRDCCLPCACCGLSFLRRKEEVLWCSCGCFPCHHLPPLHPPLCSSICWHGSRITAGYSRGIITAIWLEC